MHRFLSKKNGDAASSPLSPPTTSNKKWKKNKKELVEEKPQLDLGSALPSIDDFRTSLIMPNLSTRFSMLREQDDPHSLLGKASDDSVLQPQRNSRLLDFGFSSNSNLNDIAEVESINSSIRPPFTLDRTGSFASEEGYGTDNNSNADGSVMTRSRPGEGNVLFGGRQKVYKIATGSAKSIGGNSERAMGGKMLYDDDMNMSAFQKYRQQERERLLAMGADWTATVLYSLLTLILKAVNQMIFPRGSVCLALRPASPFSSATAIRRLIRFPPKIPPRQQQPRSPRNLLVLPFLLPQHYPRHHRISLGLDWNDQ
jgi:hypothetical protein